MAFSPVRTIHPRLYHPVDDPDYRFAPPTDPVRRRILANILADCETFASSRPWKRIPERLDSPHPFHQLYITFYSGMHATTLIEHYAFAWRLTGDHRWLKRARTWLLAACEWEHSDRIEEHFYTVNRYMHAFAMALDLLDDQLTPAEKETVTGCLVGLMQRWWPEVDQSRRAAESGHHAVVDNGHFGVAAVHLLGKHPEAPAWVEAVVERFRHAIMPHGCGRDGEPVDGSSFWPWENMWMLHFADALRNVVGLDLYREFPRRCVRPLKWFRYQLVRPEHTLGAGRREVWSPTLLRLSQDAGDAQLRQVALGDEHLGRIYRFGVGVKKSSAECMIAYGPYAYCYYDPHFRPRSQPARPLSRTFANARYGESAILRHCWDYRSMVAQVIGYGGGVVHSYSDLQIQWAGHPVLRQISAFEAQPVGCGSLPCVGGQNELVAVLSGLKKAAPGDRLRVRSTRVDHEYWLLRSDPPVLLAALRRRPRGVAPVQRGGEAFVRLDGRDYLQYPREPYFNPDGGSLRLRLRLREDLDPQRPQILFSMGMGSGESGQPNVFTLGSFGGEGLAFAVRSQRGHQVEARIPPEMATLKKGKWHEVAAVWGGFNDPKGRPFIEVELDGSRQRFDDAASFGEVGVDVQQLHARTTPRTFYIRPNTLLALGAAMQLPGTGVQCDIARVELQCPGREELVVDFADGLGPETGSGKLAWKLNPVDLRKLGPARMRLGAGRQVVEVLSVFPDTARFESEVVPFAPSGLAAGSLKRLTPGIDEPATRVLATTADEVLVLAFAPGRARARVVRQAGGFALTIGKSRYRFAVNPSGRSILTQR